MFHSLLDFPENKSDSRKPKKLQELAQQFSAKCRHVCTKTKALMIV